MVISLFIFTILALFESFSIDEYQFFIKPKNRFGYLTYFIACLPYNGQIF